MKVSRLTYLALRALRGGSRMTTTEIGRHAGVPAENLKSALNKLVGANLVTRESTVYPARYQIVNTALTEVDAMLVSGAKVYE